MALAAYLTIVAERQGPILGSVTQKGRENQILVTAVHHEIVCPRDPQSGIPTGKRMHKPFTITKELDQSTPLLFQVLCTNENIREAPINFKMANIRSPRLTYLKEYEEVSFTYQKISWTWNDGGKSAEDDWETPR